MKRTFGLTAALLMVLCMTGCSAIGEKNASIAIVYAVMAVVALLMLVACFLLLRRKEPWFLVLFVAVLIVNCGYYLLARSSTLSMALWANRISYLGSVFLPASMLMIALRVIGLRYPKWLSYLLLGAAVLVFLVAASPGVLPIYYKEVSLEIVNGVSVLNKVYGPWHILYLIYLLCYYIAIIGVLVHAALIHKLPAQPHVIFLVIAVTVNVGVWFLEQLVKIEFEFLAVSYIISEMFLLGMYAMQKTEHTQPDVAVVPATPAVPDPEEAQRELFLSGISKLTNAENVIFHLYLEGKRTKEVMAQLNITENTLKYHNRNLYSKLGVSSRKELIAMAQVCKLEE